MTGDIRSWLKEHGLTQLTAVFLDNDIDLDILADLGEQDLKELGLSLGDRKRVKKAIAASVATAATPATNRQDAAERRQLTVMFCDLVDSTGLSVRVDPEDLRHIISRFQACCERVVASFGGSVARYMGDGLLVYFGYPIADEHDAERAVRAGLEVVRAVGQLDVVGAAVLRTRVGIATGEVVVGDLIGEGLSQEHAVIGETPNLAARLQSLAEPDTVVIAPTSRKLAGPLFAYHDLGVHRLKGFAKAVRAWRVECETDVESRFEAKHANAEMTAILGRDAEIDLLMARWARARRGDSQSVLIRGGAGIGKSRLSLALRKQIAAEPHVIVRYFCVPYHQETALYPVAMQLQRAAGITRADAADEKLRKIERMVAEFSNQPQDIVPLYAALLAVPLNAQFAPLGISRRLQKEQTLATLEAQITELTRKCPVLVVFEDIHWVDPTSLELIERVIQNMRERKILFVFTCRPTFQSPWPETEKFTIIELEKLGQEHALSLIEQVSGGKPLPPSVVRQILDKTDGVPLFVEELTQSLLESGQLEERDGRYVVQGSVPNLVIPDTLQDSLMARLDRLGPGKKAAQIGAAIGRTFSYELIARVTNFSGEQLGDALQRLEEAGLVFRNGEPPRAEYLFKHALVQDAAYSTLLKDKRRLLHRIIADALELYFPETAQQTPETLAHHYTRAGEIAKAIPLWEAAARMSIERAAHEEARRHLDLALELLEQLPDDVDRMQLEVDLQIAMGLALESTRGYAAQEVAKAYDRAMEICEKLEKTADLVPVLLGLYVFNFVRGNFATAGSFVERCVKLSKESRRLDYLIESFAALGFVQGHMGELSAAKDTFEDGISLYESRASAARFVRITAQDPGVAAQSLLPVVLLQLGDVEQAERVMQNAFTLAERLDRSINLAVAHTHASEFYALQRDFDRAREHGQKAMQISLDHGHDPWYVCAMIHTGIAQSAGQVNPDGIAMAQEGLALWDGAGARVNTSYFTAMTGWCLHIAGRYDEAQALMTRAFDSCEQSHEYLHISLIHRQYGEMFLDREPADQESAEGYFRAAIKLAASHQARLPELRAATCLHRLLTSQGRGDDPAAGLGRLLGFFPSDCHLADVRDARAELALPAAAGNPR